MTKPKPVFQHIHEFETLPGVVEVLQATPAPGYVTLVVEPGHEDVAKGLKVPPGCQVFVKVAESG